MSANKLRLYGYNNLTKSLSFNIYDVCYAKTQSEKREYLAYINEAYNSERLTEILLALCNDIGAVVLNLSKQDYDPMGASVDLLIADHPVPEALIDASNNRGSLPSPYALNAHLDKSHVSVHTFPESHPNAPISTFRVDIDVATCGQISPLASLERLIAAFESDVISIDYRIRGFTRSEDGQMHFLDHEIESICDFMEAETLARYEIIDRNYTSAFLYHSRLMKRDLKLEEYLFKRRPDSLSNSEAASIEAQLRQEMAKIFYAGFAAEFSHD
ncbi:MAG: adenosylmethionine decarboxylase [Eubacteriales bacterium]|nr:adenosylmethionine decarboxylase [Eubacteriales bacterium]